MSAKPKKMPNGRYRIRVYGGLNPATGKPRQLSKVFEADNDRHAARLADTIRADLRAKVDEIQAARGTIGELADEWLNLKIAQGRSPITIDGYRHHVAAICARFGDTPVNDLTGRDLDRWYVSEIANGIGAPTIRARHTVLRGILRQAKKWGAVDRVATEDATQPTHKAARPRPWTPQELAAALANTPLGERRRVFEIAAVTGMRRGEVCGLWWSDIEAGTLTVRSSIAQPRDGTLIRKSTKTGSERSFVLGRTAQTVLAEQLEWVRSTVTAMGVDWQPGDNYVFPDLAADISGDTPHRPTWITNVWAAWLERHGMRHMSFHGLRHMNATVMLGAGVPLHSVQAQEGHANASTTLDTYGHATDHGAEMARTVIEEHIGQILMAGRS